MPSKKRSDIDRKYDVCLSFAGEDRAYVAKVASQLQSRGVRVFYDEYEKVSLWGKDLYEHLSDVYQNAARYCALFISKYYAERLWTNHERKSAQARAFKESDEYILPARFDDTVIPALRDTIGYVSLSDLSPKELSDLIVGKVGLPKRNYYLPPVPDILFKRLRAKTQRERKYVFQQAEEFVDALERMSEKEKRLLTYVFRFGCPSELPDNIHIAADLLRRLSGMPVSKCLRELQRLESLGIRTKLRPPEGVDGIMCIELSIYMRGVDYDGPEDATGTAHEMIDALSETYCTECSLNAAINGDFSALARATVHPEKHAKRKKSTVDNRSALNH